MKQGRGSARSKSRGRCSKLRCYICNSEEHLKRDYARYNYKKSQVTIKYKDQVSGYRADGYDSADVMMVISVEQLLDWIMNSGGSYHMTYMRDYFSDFEEYDGSNVLLGGGRECRVQGTGKVRVQMRDGSSFVLDNVRASYRQFLQPWYQIFTKEQKQSQTRQNRELNWKEREKPKPKGLSLVKNMTSNSRARIQRIGGQGKWRVKIDALNSLTQQTQQAHTATYIKKEDRDEERVN
ncbi:hypothetical protein Tco_0116063 [Tanacetum coccineum]